MFKLSSRLYFAAKECRFNFVHMLLNDTLRSALAFMIGFGIAILINREMVKEASVFFLLCSILISLLIYVIVFFLLGFNGEERRYIKNLVCSLKNKIIR